MCICVIATTTKIQTLGEKNNFLFHFHEKETKTARAKCTVIACHRWLGVLLFRVAPLASAAFAIAGTAGVPQNCAKRCLALCADSSTGAAPGAVELTTEVVSPFLLRLLFSLELELSFRFSVGCSL
jgi:hypothetical protein